ncbi:hypothetical protein BT96DRAFT_912501 [Gymnopus androsaceus JB14]|uniref:Class II aldolase/adducin N-terminal domain-containing protein n=1 Tax=Gymnopus androsaceus JB14 TaxID=1447944 RepID=A0A6A4IMK0_9AGAR|nr:hypothetical protein BT96DRAFT_912501 [Gymnopus androsaceus JB14]
MLVLVGPDDLSMFYVCVCHVNLPYASAFHKTRPDMNAAAHCHSIYGKAWSVLNVPLIC